MRNVNPQRFLNVLSFSPGFILTMRNVNCCDRYKQCEEIECFILTMRNVNYKYLFTYSKFLVSFILTMRNVNVQTFYLH